VGGTSGDDGSDASLYETFDTHDVFVVSENGNGNE